MRFKKVFALLLTGIMSVSAPAFVYASSTEEQLADVQAQKEAAQADLAQEQANMASLESKKQELESYLAELNARSIQSLPTACPSLESRQQRKRTS